MREKYVEERIGGRYFVFGGDPANGRVDVASARHDTVATVLPEDAERMIADHNELVDLLCAMADAFDKADQKAFQKFWYGDYPFSTP
jgi:hypothetical protein